MAAPMKRKKKSQGGSLRKKLKTYTLKPALNNLPQEIIDRICDFLNPCRDTLLVLRSVCNDLASRTSHAFGSAYFESFTVLLSRVGWSMLQDIPNHQNIGSYITHLRLNSPCSQHRTYANFMLAKGWATGLDLARACSRLPSVHTLGMVDFDFNGCRPFVGEFLCRVRMGKLKHVHLFDVHTEGEDLAAFIFNHKRFLHQISMNTVNLTGGHNSFARDMAGEGKLGECAATMFCTPWSVVFDAMRKLDEPCSVMIERPMQFDHDLPLLTSMDSYHDKDGLSISRGPEEDDISDVESLDLEDLHICITIQRNEKYGKSVAMLDDLYHFSIYDPNGHDTPQMSPCYGSDYGGGSDCVRDAPPLEAKTSDGTEQDHDSVGIASDSDHINGLAPPTQSIRDESAIKPSSKMVDGHETGGTEESDSALAPKPADVGIGEAQVTNADSQELAVDASLATTNPKKSTRKR